MWGTLRNCTYRTVLSTLRKLTSVGENVEVQRNFEKRDSLVVPHLWQPVSLANAPNGMGKG